ncbi:hypothetical protein [Labrys sp. 22185]|uniref:hypothetical protein n=1 Tax=Labrys sp. 22185 TaxID=3453888 RepID=UPI003F83637D
MARSFNQRVLYAARALVRHEDSRAHDNCFEMGDGALVVAALMRRARQEPELDRAIRHAFRSAGIGEWEETASRYAHVRDLAKAAREMRAENSAQQCLF